ncbi:hypothetical protein QUF73_02150 [Cytobacillus sp. NJ13]|nr:hypothetical protein [Cytobacillus sp. NJ13]
MALNLTQQKLNTIFIEHLSDSIINYSDIGSKPIEIDLCPPLPVKIRLYIYNMTQPLGERSFGDHKIQLIVPGQKRGNRADFDDSKGRIVVLAGYESDLGVFALWDAGLYPNFAYSRNVQVKANTVYRALAGEIGMQERVIRGQGKETVITTTGENLRDALVLRMHKTEERVMNGGLKWI